MSQLDLIDTAPEAAAPEPTGPPCPICAGRGEETAMRFVPNARRPAWLRCPRCALVRPLPPGPGAEAELLELVRDWLKGRLSNGT